MASLKMWVKSRENILSRALYNSYFLARYIEMPAPKNVFKWVDLFHKSVVSVLQSILRIGYYTPVFKSRCASVGKQFYLYGGIPYTCGPLNMSFGSQCRVSGKTTLTGRCTQRYTPQLKVGDNVDLGWMTTVAVGSKVEIGNNVRIAGQCFLAGYPGHPLNAEKRAMGLPEEDTEVGDIILEDNVWLATGVAVMAGVTIGKNSVIAAGSVVTKDIPDGVLAGGVPARMIRKIHS